MMISVMNNDFDLERNQASISEAEEARVSNDANVVVNNWRDEKLGDDLYMNEEVRVRVRISSGHDLGTRKSGTDEIRVLGGTHCRVNGDSGNLGRFEASSGNEGEDGDGEIDFRDQDEEHIDAQNHTRGSSTSSFNAVGGDKMRKRSARNNAVKMDGTIGEFSLGKRSDLRVSVSNDVGASDMNAVIRDGSMKILGSGFEMGDMVWAKVKSHPWWPGHIFNEVFVPSSIRRTRRDGHVLVAFFGDSSYGWFDPAELIPYGPHYAEKSQQINSRNFLKAVEESVDEASKRSALGLSCRCLNPYNFRPTNVLGYLAVDVVDHEQGAIYSVNQIQNARESFRPSETITFIKQLAAAPRSGENKSLDFIQQKATALAYRRSIFEEFDETYAQAFGQEPVRPSQSPQPLTDKEPSRAPLNGPLVTAEALGGRKSSTKSTKPKNLSKKDRYLFKHRVEAGDFRTGRISQVHPTSSSSSAYEDVTSDSAAASYVFQKRDHTISTSDNLGGTPTTDQMETSARYVTTKDAPSAGHSVTIGLDVSESSSAMTAEVSGVHGLVPDSSHISSISSTDTGLVKKKKVGKRPAGERSSEKSDISEKKMKKLRKTDFERTNEHPERLSSGSGEAHLMKPAGNSVTQQVGSVSIEADAENEVELPQMLADLQGLALNPFHGAERNGPTIARYFFLKFRSLVFLKASSALPMAESEPGEARAIRSPPASEPTDKPPTDSSKAIPSLKPPSKPSTKPEDSTKAGRKRLPSDRQEEIAAKRAKKITQVKSLGAEKRAALLKNPELLRADGKAKVVSSQQPSSKPMKKADRPARVEEPTYLIMKFQSGSSLPSLVELKARFARFGPLDTSLSRVFYKTNTCRVAFLYKQDANVAYRYAVGSKSVFSNVKFMLKPVAAPEPQQPSSSSNRVEDLLHGDHQPPNLDPSAVEPRPALPTAPLMHQLQQPVQQLKSCLKKPSVGDEPVCPANGTVTIRTPRVRFNMSDDQDGVDNKGGVVQVQMDSTNVMSSSSSSEGGPSSSLSSSSSSSSSSTSVAMDVVINNQRFMSSLPLQPPPLPQPPQFPRAPMLHHTQHHVEVAPPMNNNFKYNLTAATRLPGVALAPPPPLPPSIDISQQLMGLLTECHDVVTNVKTILGYVPYHTL